MGCVYSKVATRSRSAFQGELSLSLQRRTNGVPALEDLLAKKNGGGDQFMALLCTANTVAAKLRAVGAAREQDKPSPPSTEPEDGEKVSVAVATTEEEPTGPETINTWELMADLDLQEDGEKQVEREGDVIQHQQRHLMQHPQELARSSSLGDGEGVSRARTFRTVDDDLDAIVTGDSTPLVLKEADDIPSDDHPPDTNGQAHVITGGAGRGQEPQDGEEEEGDRSGTTHRAPGGRTYGSDCPVVDAKAEVPDADSMVLSWSPSARGKSAGAEGNGVAGAGSFTELKGLRRRAIGKELKTLKVPSFEFSGVGRLREWVGGGGPVFSPGSYVTPKFGSFGSEAAVVASGGGDAAEREEETLFDPQLVADLEEAMERMTMEEEHILRQIVESLQGSHGEDARLHGEATERFQRETHTHTRRRRN